MLGWAVVTVGLLISPKAWMKVVGLVSGTMELVVGIPLAFVTATQLGRFSLFALGPIACLILLVILVWGKTWEKWSETQ
jgi:bacteriorhodopsin